MKTSEEVKAPEVPRLLSTGEVLRAVGPGVSLRRLNHAMQVEGIRPAARVGITRAYLQDQLPEIREAVAAAARRNGRKASTD